MSLKPSFQTGFSNSVVVTFWQPSLRAAVISIPRNRGCHLADESFSPKFGMESYPYCRKPCGRLLTASALHAVEVKATLYRLERMTFDDFTVFFNPGSPLRAGKNSVPILICVVLSRALTLKTYGARIPEQLTSLDESACCRTSGAATTRGSTSNGSCAASRRESDLPHRYM